MAEQILTSEIVITPEAAEEIRRIKTENQIPESLALRLGVKSSSGGGCGCGTSYILGFDDKAGEADRVIQTNGLTVFVDPQSLTQLSGTTLGFSNDPEQRGFYFDNPNKESCGCNDGGCSCEN